MDIRQQKNILLNLQQLYLRNATRSQLRYMELIEQEYDKTDVAAIKQAFSAWLNRTNTTIQAITWD